MRERGKEMRMIDSGGQKVWEEVRYRVRERQRRRYKGRKGGMCRRGNILFTLTLTSIVEYLKRERGFLRIRHGSSFGDLSLKHFYILSSMHLQTYTQNYIRKQTEIPSLSTRTLTHTDTHIDTHIHSRTNRPKHSNTYTQTLDTSFILSFYFKFSIDWFMKVIAGFFSYF